MTTSTDQNSNPIETGKEIVCYCTKCKMDLGHTIMSVVSGIPARVICRTCKSEHNYKAKKGVKDPGAAPKKASTPRAKKVAEKTVPVEVEWLRQINASTRSAREYGADQFFQPNDKIAHPSFGEGIIQKLVYPNKVEVLFKTDIKVLIHKPVAQ